MLFFGSQRKGVDKKMKFTTAIVTVLALMLVGCGPCPIDADADSGSQDAADTVDPDVAQDATPDAADAATECATEDAVTPDAADAAPVCEDYAESRGTIVNVALVRPATQDSTFTVSGGLHTANFAVDGFECFGTSDRFAFNTETADGAPHGAWWEVDLQSNYRLDHVVIHPWTWGHVQGTTVNGVVEFLDCNRNIVSSVPFGMVEDYPGQFTMVPTDARARYVRIRRVSDEITTPNGCAADTTGIYHANCTLSLCEVEVFGHI